jgi:Ca-activated chloride channel family protein
MIRRCLFSALLAAATPVAAEENVVLVLDASGSMWGQIEGRSKVEIAKEAVAELVGTWDRKNNLGLVAYGHRRKGDCGDIEVLIPHGPLDPAAFMARVEGLKFLGMTPLSAAVIQAADSLRSSEQKATVILVSDGEETCEMDPCAVGRELEARGVDFTAHVIGFNVPDPAHQAQLRCLAENTGGRYFNARDAGELGGALATLAAISTEPVLPPASATIKGPASAPAASIIEIDWTGPADDGDYVAITGVDAGHSREHDYAWAVADKPRVPLMTPATAGQYELRYVSSRRNPPVLARAPLTVTELEATIEAADSAMAGTTIEVIATGPVSEKHWIGFAPKGSPAGTYRDYERPTGPTSTIRLSTPSEPGDYELRYVLNESERVLVSHPIRITPAEASVEAPDSAEAGTEFEVVARGPAEDGHWIGLAPKGSPAGTYRDYVRPTGPETRARLLAPSEPGDYEVRYVLRESEEIAASRPIRIVDGTVSIEAPAEVRASETLRVRAAGPVGRGNHWIGFAPKGSPVSAYRDYERPSGPISEIELTAPEEPGEYELRYVFGESERIRVARPITVLPRE